jgi:sec-independent protein translocase protein TatB
MFGIGLPELLIIGVLILLFVNPKEMPSLFRKVARAVNEMRKMREGFLKGMRDLDPGSEGSENARETSDKVR